MRQVSTEADKGKNKVTALEAKLEAKKVHRLKVEKEAATKQKALADEL